VRAITTASPDIPEEVGRQLTRMPPMNAGAAVSYSFAPGKLAGTSVSASYAYISAYTAYYEDRNRFRLDYPGYGQMALSVSRSITKKPLTHQVSLSVRNLLNLDMLASQARAGGQREFTAGYRILF
jgi:iron complex outermembrane receptor protein